MKKLHFYIFLLLMQQSIIGNNFTLDNHLSPQAHKTINFFKDHYLSIAACSSAVYFQKIILDDIKNHPYVSSIAMSVAISYFCDVMLNSHQQKNLINTMNIVKKIAFYLTISIGIKNLFSDHMKKQNKPFNETIFLNNIVKDSRYTFDEIENLVLKVYHDIQDITEQQHFTLDLSSEECAYFLFAKHISIADLYKFVRKDKDLQESINLIIDFPEEYVVSFAHILRLKVNPLINQLDNSLHKKIINESFL